MLIDPTTPIIVELPNGEQGELHGMVKMQTDMLDGLTGKMKKVNKQSIGSRVFQGIARVGGRIVQNVGDQYGIGNDTASVIRDEAGTGNYQNYSFSQNMMVTVPMGTRFVFVVKNAK